MFAKYHYLSHSHNNASDVYVCTVDNQIAGFISVLTFPHPTVKDMKKIHRLVIKPDFQGIGLSGYLLNSLKDFYPNKRISIVTSAPSLIYSLAKCKNWRCTRKGRMTKHKGVLSKGSGSNSSNRLTASFEYIGER